MLDEEMEDFTVLINQEHRPVLWVVDIEIAGIQFHVRDAMQLGEDEPGLVERAHPGVGVRGRECDTAGIETHQILFESLTGGDEEMPEFGRDELLPVVVGLRVAGRRIREQAWPGGGRVAPLKDRR